MIPGVSILLFLLAVVVPSGSWSPPPVSDSVGPVRYNSSLGIGPQVVWSPTGTFRIPEVVSIEFKYKVLARPADYAVLVSTSTEIENGINVTLDKWGNIYLSVQSVTANPPEYQLIKISDPQDLGRVYLVKIHINMNSDLLKISVDNRNVEIAEARPNHSVSISDFVLLNNEISLGGRNQNIFAGEILEFSMAYGRQGIRIDLINLRIFLLLLALLTAGTFIRRRKINF